MNQVLSGVIMNTAQNIFENFSILNLPNYIYDSFYSNFLNFHAGYEKIKPILLPVFFKQSFIKYISDSSIDILESIYQVPDFKFNLNYVNFIKFLNYDIDESQYLYTLCHDNLISHTKKIARADFLLTDEGFKLLEVNIGPSIGGLGILDRYNHQFLNIGQIQDHFSKNILALNPVFMLSKLFFSHESKPKILFVCADDEFDVPHPHEVAFFLRLMSLDAVVARLSELRFLGNKIVYNGVEFNIIFSCFTFDQMLCPEIYNFTQKAVSLHVNNKIILFSPPVFTLFGNKTILSLLCENEFKNKLPLTKRKIINQLIPHTRKFDINSSLEAKLNKNDFVLKPGIGNGGKGVVIGRNTNQPQWEMIIKNILDSRENYVIQDYLKPSVIKFIFKGQETSFFLNLGVLIIEDNLAGLLIRVTPHTEQEVINCKQGAYFASAFVTN